MKLNTLSISTKSVRAAREVCSKTTGGMGGTGGSNRPFGGSAYLIAVAMTQK